MRHGECHVWRLGEHLCVSKSFTNVSAAGLLLMWEQIMTLDVKRPRRNSQMLRPLANCFAESIMYNFPMWWFVEARRLRPALCHRSNDIPSGRRPIAIMTILCLEIGVLSHPTICIEFSLIAVH